MILRHYQSPEALYLLIEFCRAKKIKTVLRFRHTMPTNDIRAFTWHAVTDDNKEALFLTASYSPNDPSAGGPDLIDAELRDTEIQVLPGLVRFIDETVRIDTETR